jgi:hypothetical protein
MGSTPRSQGHEEQDDDEEFEGTNGKDTKTPPHSVRRQHLW